MTYSLTKGETLSPSYWKLYEASEGKNEGIFYTQRISRRYFGPEARRWVGRRGREAPPIFLEPAEGKRSHGRRTGVEKRAERVDVKEGSSVFPGAKVARRSNAIPISARTSREPTIPPNPHR